MPSISIGNDIVDLQERPGASHPRFVERVCSEFEKSQLSSANPDAVWSYWAAKEAAYKCIKRLEPEVIFSPSRFEYHHDQQIVQFERQRLFVRCQTTPDYVYAVCVTDSEIFGSNNLSNWITNRSDLEKTLPSNAPKSDRSESHLVRLLARRELSKLLSIPIDQITISPRSHGIPLLSLSGPPHSDLLSLSHHGRFLACSYLRTPKLLS
ncbi:MAG: hypothetical protein DCC75_01940 [Proteobacteria bacterium]|nr:MAG: hypothetical protein DCC75_01940 [Pseudomonadota bacterium]